VSWWPEPAVLAVVAAGGVAGAEARYALTQAWPAVPGAWPLTTFLVNVSGSLLLGALMVLVVELTAAHRLVRPFLGVGVLGGYTTFSSATLETHELFLDGHVLLGVGYGVATAVTTVLAAAVGALAMRRLAGGRSDHHRDRGGSS
jgi:CrcB protein